MKTVSEFIKENHNASPDQLALMCETIDNNTECRIYIIAEYGDIEYEEELDDYTINLFTENCSDSESFDDSLDGEDDKYAYTDVYWLTVSSYLQLIRNDKIKNILNE